jgi:hypothetical protein
VLSWEWALFKSLLIECKRTTLAIMTCPQLITAKEIIIQEMPGIINEFKKSLA